MLPSSQLTHNLQMIRHKMSVLGVGELGHPKLSCAPTEKEHQASLLWYSILNTSLFEIKLQQHRSPSLVKMVPTASHGDSAGNCTTDPGVEMLPYRDVHAPQRLGNITVISIKKAISQTKRFSLQPLCQHSHPLREGHTGTGKAGQR